MRRGQGQVDFSFGLLYYITAEHLREEISGESFNPALAAGTLNTMSWLAPLHGHEFASELKCVIAKSEVRLIHWVPKDPNIRGTRIK